jgi:TonB family protein
MNRLQKKCVITTAGIHLLLLLILIVGPGFFNPKPKADDTQVLDVIPANLIDAAFSSGVKNATPPAPAPIVQPQPAPTPKPAVQPPPAPAPTLVERVERIFKSEPAKPVPTPVPTENPSHKIQVNTQLVARSSTKSLTTKTTHDDSRVINNAIRSLKNNLSSATEIDMPGNSSAAYANYGAAVVSVYHNAWISPDDMANDSAVVKFSVTIASDGTVIGAHIIDPSGDTNVDAAVQRMLSRVAFIAPFPNGATEKERTYTINFNASRTTE